MKKILVPLDGSAFAEAVLPHAEEFARAEEAELVLLRVPVVESAIFVSQDPQLIAQTIEEANTEADEYIKAEVEKVRADGCVVTGITQVGMVTETILQVADQIHADLIAMSTHGRTGLGRALMGSVADGVIHKTHIPLLLVHPN